MCHTPEKLGLKEKKALRLIARREERGDPSPGLLEIGCVVGLEGTRGARELLSRLARDGYLIWDEGWERMLRLTGLGWRLFTEENPDRPDGGAVGQGGELHHTDAAEISVVEEPEPDLPGPVVALAGGKTSPKRPRYAESPSHAQAGDVPVDPGDGPAVWPRRPVPGTDT
jgi:SOS-response transcriptional repressor LexA